MTSNVHTRAYGLRFMASCVHIYIYTHCIYACMHACMLCNVCNACNVCNECMSVCMSVCLSVCLYVCMFPIHIHIHLHIHVIHRIALSIYTCIYICDPTPSDLSRQHPLQERCAPSCRLGRAVCFACPCSPLRWIIVLGSVFVAWISTKHRI